MEDDLRRSLKRFEEEVDTLEKYAKDTTSERNVIRDGAVRAVAAQEALAGQLIVPAGDVRHASKDLRCPTMPKGALQGGGRPAPSVVGRQHVEGVQQQNPRTSALPSSNVGRKSSLATVSARGLPSSTPAGSGVRAVRAAVGDGASDVQPHTPSHTARPVASANTPQTTTTRVMASETSRTAVVQNRISNHAVGADASRLGAGVAESWADPFGSVARPSARAPESTMNELHSHAHVSIQVRGVDGIVRRIGKLFSPRDTLRIVLQEYLRLYPLTAPYRATDLSFVVPWLQTTYDYESMKDKTLKEASLCPTATIVLHHRRSS